MTDWANVKLDVKKVTQYVWVNLDEDGTPLNSHGERMIETSPGVWEEPLIVAALKFIEEHGGLP